MEELGRAIEMLLNPRQNYTNEVKAATQDYLEKVIVDNQRNFTFFFTLLATSTDVHVKFWAVGALEKLMATQSAEFTTPQKQELHSLFFQILLLRPAVVLGHPHIEHKYALLFILLVRADYPVLWPDAFSLLFSLLTTPAAQQDLALKLGYISTPSPLL